MLRPPGSQTLKAAGSVTLKLGAGSMGGTSAFRNINSDGVSFDDIKTHLFTNHRRGYPEIRPEQKAEVPTVWDEPDKRTLEQIKVLDQMGNKVVKMSSTFEGVTNMKQEKAAIMDEMHEHSLEKVEDLRQHMEALLAELKTEISAFQEEYTQQMADQMDVLDVELRERIAALAARYDALEERTRKLHVSIKAETQSRLVDTEALMGPVRKMVADLETDLHTEKEIREIREVELTEHMQENVRLQNIDLEKEIANRIDRHKEERLHFEKEAARLLKRHEGIGVDNTEIIKSFNSDMAQERQLRVAGQDHVVEQITNFIKKFQDHVLEEGDMGN